MSDQCDPSANVLMLVGNATAYIEKMVSMHQAFFDEKLRATVDSSRRERVTESDRIDALREVDRKAVEVANDRSIKQAEVLANQLAENAEALRASMAKQAETLALQVQQVTSSLDSRLKLVEEKQYLLSGASKGSRDMWGWIVGGIAVAVMVINFIWDKMP